VPANPDRYPADGLVLRLTARDLPREVDVRPDDWRKNAWNMDYAWFSAAEAAAMVPDPLTQGARQEAPSAVLQRLARFHLRDFVRGEPSVWPAEALRGGMLVAEVAGVSGERAQLHLSGNVRLEWEARWVRPENREQQHSDTGFAATLVGEAEWDARARRFTRFDLLAAGPRWGTNQYNNRQDDLGPAPLGIVFQLAGSEPRDRTPPHTIYHREYFGTGGGGPD
jgi:hypothetical protein